MNVDQDVERGKEEREVETPGQNRGCALRCRECGHELWLMRQNWEYGTWFCPNCFHEEVA